MSFSYIFRSTDDGAPQLSDSTAGTLNTVLKAVLVNGYGAISPLGWAVEYDEPASFTTVYRAPEGTRFPVRVENSNTTINSAKVQAYESMSAVSEGILPCPPNSEIHNNYIKYGHTVVYNASIPWIILGDTKGFYLFVQDMYGYTASNPLTAWRMHYIGDYTCYQPHSVDKYNFIMHLEQYSSYHYWYHGYAAHYVYVMRNPITYTRDPVRIKSDTCNLHGIVTKAVYGGFLDIDGLPTGADKLWQPMYILNYTTRSTTYGTYPGMLEPVTEGETNNGYGSALEPYYEVAGDKKILLMPFGYSNTYTHDTYAQRLGFIVGEGFRNVA